MPEVDSLLGPDPSLKVAALRVERDSNILVGVRDRHSMDRIAADTGVDRSTVYRTVQKAKKLGAIRTSVDIPRFLLEEGDPTVNLSVDRAFNLTPVALVRVPSMFIGEQDYDFNLDGTLHRILGHAAALELNKLVKAGDKVGVGSGQGILDFARAFIEGRVSLPYNDLEVYSLVGNAPTYEDTFQEYRSFAGADEVVFEFANSVPNFRVAGITRRPPYSPTADKNYGSFDLLESETAVEPSGIDVAIFGLGSVFHPNHQPLFGLSAFTHNPELINELQATEAYLAGREDFIGYHPLLEYLNRIVVVNPLADVPTELMDHLETLRTLVEKVNSQAVRIDENSLKEIPVRIGIAGGIHKMAQIRYAVTQGIINYLVTDELTAKRLAALKR